MHIDSQLKETKVQHAQSGNQRKADTQAAVSALGDLLSANGLVPADAKGYIDPLLVSYVLCEEVRGSTPNREGGCRLRSSLICRKGCRRCRQRAYWSGSRRPRSNTCTGGYAAQGGHGSGGWSA